MNSTFFFRKSDKSGWPTFGMPTTGTLKICYAHFWCIGMISVFMFFLNHITIILIFEVIITLR